MSFTFSEKEFDEAQETISELRALLREASETISFYADKANWFEGNETLDEVRISDKDVEMDIKCDGYYCGGRKARSFQTRNAEQMKRIMG